MLGFKATHRLHVHFGTLKFRKSAGRDELLFPVPMILVQKNKLIRACPIGNYKMGWKKYDYSLKSVYSYESCRRTLRGHKFNVMQTQCSISEFLWIALLCQYLQCSVLNLFVPNQNDFDDSKISAHPMYHEDNPIMIRLMARVKTFEFATVHQIGNLLQRPKGHTFFKLGILN